ncbi:hypothetical protein KIPB_008343 [Kipferlia bialata]|uniref:3-beta hydroxysteroid dehydrogenase/isomerase domain-containing protein n=1 Tax=Kipferlia bialata TaxID=797122 RepID=A0A391P4F6_9EUKA|nr:hypothetical protein KIPB_008343 [Kipferlia bialata]|eukprot:g8343.t1
MKVLILGGCGFIGRHLVQFLASQEGVTVRVADKKIPVMCHLNEAMQDLYDNEDFCEFLQSDLSREA